MDQAFEARKARNDRFKARVLAGAVPGVKGVFNKLKQGFQLRGEAAKEQATRREQAKLEGAIEKDKQFMMDNGIDEETAQKVAVVGLLPMWGGEGPWAVHTGGTLIAVYQPFRNGNAKPSVVLPTASQR